MTIKGVTKAPTPKVIPSIVNQYSGLSFLNALIMSEKDMIFIMTMPTPETNIIVPILSDATLRLHTNKDEAIIPKQVSMIA